MAHGEFVGCDLSTRRMDVAKNFYGQLFGWRFDEAGRTEDDYHFASVGRDFAAGIFTMPEKFQAIGMPCFWMSYIEVGDAERVAQDARNLGGRVELGPMEWGEGVVIALIRDPSGAGFTIVEGQAFPKRPRNPRHGQMLWNELSVPDADEIVVFYEKLFGWEFNRQDKAGERYSVSSPAGDEITAVQVLPDELRGKERYWGIYFAVDNLETALKCVLDNDGALVFNDNGVAGVRDPDGAFFFLQAN